MAKNSIFIRACFSVAVLFSACLSRNEITDAPASPHNNEVLPVVPISVFDTIHVQVVINDTIKNIGTAKKPVIKKPDTTKIITVFPKSFEQLAAAVRKTYTSQIGVYEKTGHNDGVQIEKYQAATHAPKYSAYCASGVCWSFVVNGIVTTINAAAASTFNKNNLVWFSHKFFKTPYAGADVVQFWIVPLHGIHHCGFYDKDHGNGNYESVEFNTTIGGDGIVRREGGGVGRKVRSWNGTYGATRWIKSVK